MVSGPGALVDGIFLGTEGLGVVGWGRAGARVDVVVCVDGVEEVVGVNMGIQADEVKGWEGEKGEVRHGCEEW